MDALIILSRNGIIDWASSAVFELLGYTPDELPGTDIFKLTEAYPEKTKQLFSRIQEHPARLYEGLRQFRKKNGESVPLYLTVSSLPGEAMPAFVLLHLQLFRQGETEGHSLLLEKAEIELNVLRKAEQEIAAELHDHVNPNLVGAKLLLDFFLNDPSQQVDQLKKVSAVLADLICDVRNLSHTIIEKTEKDLELGEAISAFIENFKSQSSVRIVLRYDRRLEENLSNRQKVHIVRVIQEQLMNIIRHASASKILISLQQTGEKLALTTKDNGKGFEPSRFRNGIGISNMLRRVNELGGNMHISSKCNEGTLISILLPVNCRAHQA